MNTSLKELIESYKRGEVSKNDVAAWLKRNAAGGVLQPARISTPASDALLPEKALEKIIPAPVALSTERLAALVQSDLLALLSRHLKVDLPDLDPEAPLEEYGFDSISLNEFTNVLESRWRLDLTAADLVEYDSIGRLAVHLASEHGATLRAAYSGEDNDSGRVPAPELAAVSTGLPTVKQASPARNVATAAIEPPEKRPAGDASAEPIAIIGMSGAFPGSPDVDIFWRHLVEGHDLISKFPNERRARWRGFEDLEGEPALGLSRSAGFMDDVDKFDCHFFNISPREAELMDPQQRIFLETVWHTLEDAGCKASAMAGSRVGLFVAVVGDDYMALGVRQAHSVEAYLSTGCNRCVLPNRVSHFFNWRGPSEIVDTACSSSLLAVHRAVRAIRGGECDMAIAGGVNVLLSPQTFVAFQKAGMLASDDRCKPFDERADGYVRGEGVGAVLLKPLARALADGDSIRAVIRGTSTNHSGKTSSLTVPSSSAQAECLIEAMEEAGFDPATVGYIEAHGTGTKVGDPVEISALKQAFAELGRRTGGMAPGRHCGIGSVKSNMGHLEGSAGVSSLIKVVLALEHRVLPGILHFGRLNPAISLDDGPFYIMERTREWPGIQDSAGHLLPRRAGINSFGFGGVNVHVALEEFVSQTSDTAGAAPTEPQVFLLSAKTHDRLKVVAGQMRDFLTMDVASPLADIAFTLRERREELSDRLAFVAQSRQEAAAKLGQFLGSTESAGLFVGRVRKKALAADESGKNAGRGLTRWENAAREWSLGAPVDWSHMYAGTQGRRVRLPQYPFEKKVYWLPVELIGGPVKQPANSARLDLKAYGSPEGEDGVFYRELKGDEFYLADHRIGGKTILPGVAHLELTWSAAAQWLGPGRSFLLQNVVWVRPILFDGKALRLRVSFKPKGERWRFELSGFDEDSKEWGIRSQGTLALEPVTQSPSLAMSGKVAGVQDQAVRRLANAEIYKMFSTVQFDYGPGFKSIEEIWATPGEVVARVKLPRYLSGDFASYTLHPSLLDGALQTVTGIGLASGQASGTVSLPFSVGKVRLFAPVPEEILVHLRSKSEVAAASAVRKFDIDLIDNQGRVVLSIEDFTTRQTDIAGPQPKAPEPTASAQQASAFAPAPATHGPTVGDSVVFGDFSWGEAAAFRPLANASSGLILLGGGHELAKKLAGVSGTEVIRVTAGDGFAKLDPLHWQIDRANADHYVLLLESLGAAGKLPLSVLHAWSLDPSTSVEGIAGIPRELESGLYSLVHLGHAWIKVRRKSPLAIVYAHTGETPSQVMVDGFLRSLVQEMPGVRGATAQVGAPVDILDLYASSGTRPSDEKPLDAACQIRKREGRWEQRRLTEAGTHRSTVRLKQGGSYLITGGLGGLGRIVATHLAKNYRAGLVLCGRTPLDDEKSEFLRRLRAYGSRVEYEAGDIRESGHVRRWVDRAGELLGGLNGVFHCAGAINDAAFAMKTVAKFQSVLEPKLIGTLNLEDATRDLAVDFVALFSSVASVGGSRGQTDYASANRFMDAFAAWSHPRPLGDSKLRRVVSINWPLWAEGGMTMPAPIRDKMRQISGLAPLPAEVGIAALETALCMESSQVAVFFGDASRIRAFLHMEPITIKPPESPARLETPSFDETAARSALMEIFSEVLKVPQSELDPTTDLSEYGVDSIMAMQLLNRMEERFGGHLDPSSISEYPTIEGLGRFLVESGASVLQSATTTAKAGAGNAGTHSQAAPAANAGASKTDTPKMPANADIQQAPQTVIHANAPIAVIGLACRFPGSPSVESFWENLKSGVNLVTEIPSDRWPIGDYYDADKNAPCKTYSKWGAFLEGVELFDPARFGISDADARVMDPQHRILLELSLELFNSAGYRKEDLAGQRGGVFVGAGESAYIKSLSSGPVNDDLPRVVVNSSPNMMAARISDFYDLHGPAWVMSTACSSSLVAIHSACQSLRLGESDWAVAGGAQLLPDHVAHVAFSKAGVLADDGVARVFDRNSKGFVLGEGFGLVMLKLLDAAMRDGDQIEAVILGSAVNNDGHTMGLTTPNLKAQIDVLERACAASGIGAETIGYLEAHGTGTLLGDPIEIKAASEVFRKRTQETQVCAVGSVKSNLGHALHAAAMPSVIKVVMALKHGLIPPTLHCAEPHPRFRFELSPFFPALQLQPFPNRNSPRRAGISSFGFGGTNCHMVFEQFDPVKRGYRPRRAALISPPFARRRFTLSENLPSVGYSAEVAAAKAPMLSGPAGGLSRSEAVVPGEIKIQNGHFEAADFANRTNGAATETAGAPANGVTEPSPELVRSIQRFLMERAGDAAGLPAASLSLEKNFMELGIDSVALVQMTQVLEQEIGLEIYPTLFFEYQNIRDLSLYFAREEGRSFAAYLKLPEPGAPGSRPAAPQTVEKASGNSNGIHHGGNGNTTRVAPAAAVSARPGIPPVTRSPETSGDIAIIGMAGRFADSANVDQFWTNIESGKNLISEVPPDHFDYLPFFDPHPQAPGKLYCKWGSFLDEVDKFDAGFFGISAREAELMDPQMRMILETMHSTAEDAACAGRIRGTRTGVYIGACFHDYSQELARVGTAIEPFGGTGNAASMLSNRPSYFWNLSGPSLTIDTACSSSLVALHLACQALRRGECDMAFATGVNLILGSPHYVYFCCIGALSPTGRCHTFDQRADGYVPGEAVGSVLLKPLERAIADGDPIRAVIKGSAVNHGGRSNSVTAPNPQLEAQVLTEAWNDAGIDPETIGYIEAHGTGTKLGDPVEIQGIKLAFKGRTSRTGFCAIGSAKAHIGHAEGAAGIAGVIKTVLSMQHGKIPSMPQFSELNPLIKLKDSPLYINSQPRAWEAPEGGRLRAGVSSFGFGGTYAHVVLESAPSARAPSDAPEGDATDLFIFSAKTKERLGAMLQEFIGWAEGSAKDKVTLADMAHTLRVGRETMEHRFAFVARDRRGLLAALSHGVEQFQGPAETRKASEHRDALSAIGNSSEDRRYFEDLVRSRQFEKLGVLWMKGAEVDWTKLWGKCGRKCIQIPGYPFSRQRYWHSAPVAAAAVATLAPEPKPIPAQPSEAANGRDVRGFLKESIAGLLSLSPSEIDPSDDLQGLGFDSIMGMQLIKELQERFGVRFYASEAQMHPTVGGFIDYLESEVAARPDPAAAQASPVSAAPVFVLSAPRSGSTLLRVMLAGHSRIFCPPELHLLPFDDLQARAGMLSGSAQFLGEGLARAVMELRGCTAEAATELLEDWRRKQWTVADVYQALEQMANGRIVIDKSPSYGDDIETLCKSQRLFPNARYIFLVRHPLAVMESYLRNRFDKLFNQKSDDRWGVAEDVWLRVNQNLEDLRGTLPEGKWLQVRYEDLVAAPEAQCRRICEFLQIPFEASLLQPYEGKRMVDGLHSVSLSIGDPNFRNHSAIEPELADAWKSRMAILPTLSPHSVNLARRLGFDLPGTAPKTLGGTLGPPQELFLRRHGGSAIWILEHRIKLNSRRPMDALRFGQAWNRTVRRHPMLRTVFEYSASGDYRSNTLSIADDFVPEWKDLSGWTESAQEEEFNAWRDQARKTIDLRSWPLFRAAVFQLGVGRYELLWSCHHLVGDGVSSAQVISEILQECLVEKTAAAIPWPEAPSEYSAYVREVSELSSAEGVGHKAFWESQLRGEPLLLKQDLPAAESLFSSECELSFAGSELGLRGPPSLEACSVALYRVLSEWSGAKDPVLAHRLHGRPPTFLQPAPVVGCFAIDVPIRFSNLPSESPGDALRRFRALLASIPSGGTTYAPLVLAGELSQANDATPVRLNYQPRALVQSGDGFEIEHQSVRPFQPADQRRPYLLDFVVRADPDNWVLLVRYSSAHHLEDSVRRLVAGWAACVRELA